MDSHDRRLKAAEEATKAVKNGKGLAKVRQIESKNATNLEITNHIDGFSFLGVDDWGQIKKINVYES